MIIDMPLGVAEGGTGGHIILPTPDENLTESDVVEVVTAALPETECIPSLYGVQNWSNVMTKRIIYSGSIPSGATGIGTWVDGTEYDTLVAMSKTDRETKEGSGTGNYGWWYDANFVGIGNEDEIDIQMKYNPGVADKERIDLGGYILDDETGYMCIKFAQPVTKSTHEIAVDITITRTNVS